MNRSLSLYLDGLRVLAALTVFISHLGNFTIIRLPIIVDQGSNAVAVFFVLSGFVIAYCAVEKEQDLKTYLTARGVRLYSVVPVALAVTFLADLVTVQVNRPYFVLLHTSYELGSVGDWAALLRYLTFTNQIWFTHSVFGTNNPYWSIAFEAWYYLLFGLWVFIREPRMRLGVCLVGAMICGPKIIMYLPLWLCGATAYYAIRGAWLKLSRPQAIVLCVASVIGLIGVVYGFNRYIGPIYLHFSWKNDLKICAYYTVIGVCVALNIIGFSSLTTDGLRSEPHLWGDFFARCVRWVSGGSFTLYLVHQPLLIMLCALMPDAKSKTIIALGVAVLCMVMVAIIAELGERRKSDLARLVRRSTHGPLPV